MIVKDRILSLQFLESIQLRYDSQAAEREIAIIGSCGFDSVAADLGVETIRQECDQKDLGIQQRNFFIDKKILDIFIYRYCIH